MDKVPGVSNNMVYGRRVLPIILALIACVMWVSAAHAQEAPFNTQYDPPPTTPPECGPEDGGTGDPGGTPTSGSSAAIGVAGDFDPGASGGAEGAVGAESGCEEPQVLSATEGASGSAGILPTTGGILAAPILLGVAAIAAAGVITVRRRKNR